MDGDNQEYIYGENDGGYWKICDICDKHGIERSFKKTS